MVCLQPDCNSTVIDTGDLPAGTFHLSLSALDASLLWFSVALAITSNISCLALLYFLFRKSRNGYYVKLCSTLLALYPVYENLSCMAMFIPRATQFMSVLIGAYTMIVFNDFSAMLVLSAGGMRGLMQKVDGQVIEGPPCCRCLPATNWSRKKLMTLRLLIRQGKLVQYLFVVLSATLLLNGNYNRRPLELDQPLFWIGIIASLSRFAATISIVTFVRASVTALTGHSIGKKFIALQIINIVHIVQEFLMGPLQSLSLPIESYGFITAENRLELYRYTSLVVLTTLCQLWSTYLFYKSPAPAALIKSEHSMATALEESVSQSFSTEHVHVAIH